MKFCTVTLGCKVNQYETGAMEGILRSRGHEPVTAGSGCDVCIINTCAVTEESVRKSRQTIRRLKKLHPDAGIVVCGCFSQLDPAAVEELGVDLLSGTTDRRGFVMSVMELMKLTDKTGDSKLTCCTQTDPITQGDGGLVMADAFEELPPGETANRTRALLKIQDGCDNFCTYCIVPHIRGRSRSLPLSRMAEYAKQLDEQGYKEIVITGIEISSYGKDLHLTSPAVQLPTFNFQFSTFNSLSTAIQTISFAAPNTRLRLGSLDPAILTDEFCRQLGEIPNLCNHFHISLQSGCDGTLKRMGRKYTTHQVQQAINSIRNQFKDCGITADLITGFPGETDVEFEQTINFIKEAAFSDMHIFPYSPRPGTKASILPDQIDKKIRKERAKKALETSEKMSDDFKRSQIGKTVEVLFEQEKGGFSTGHTGNYLMVSVRKGLLKIKRNTIKPVKITNIKNDILHGEIM